METDILKLGRAEKFIVQYEQMSREQTYSFLSLIMANEEQMKQITDALNEEKSPSIYSIIKARVAHFDLQDIIPDSVVLFIDLLNYSQRNGGRPLTKDDVVNLYPEGYYTRETIQYVVDTYVKTRLLPNSKIY